MTATDTPDLDEWLAGPEPDWDTDPNPEPLADAYMANGILRTLGHVRSQLADREAMYRTERARLDEWINDERTRLRRRCDWLETWLAGWHAAQIERGGDKTIHLPSGDLAARALPDEWVFDDGSFIEWAQAQNTDWVRTPAPQVDRRTAKRDLSCFQVTLDGRVVNDMGEIVPGVTVIANRGRTYTATPTLKKGPE